MITKLIEIYNPVSASNSGTSPWKLREIFINAEHVVAMRPDNMMDRLLHEGKLPGDLDKRQSFTKIYLNRGQTGIDITVVGEPEMVEQKLYHSRKQLLKG